MVNYKDLSIAKKIRVIITLTTGAALLLASILFASVEYNQSKQALVERASVLSKLIATHVSAALVFEDVNTATSLLNSMTADPDVELAQIYTTDATQFASFESEDTGSIVASQVDQETLSNLKNQGSSRDSTSYQFNDGRLYVLTPIVLDTETIGLLYMQVSLNSLQRKAALYLFGTLIIFLVILLFTYLISARLHQRISNPIQQLLEGMGAVSKQQNYALRLADTDNDELGDITSGFNDMIEQIEQKTQEIEQHAFYDPLTGLANRRLLLIELEKEIKRCRRNHSVGALLFLDLDHFKYVNDSLGHTTGDDLLISVSQQIKKAIRVTDTPARIGGDEFVIIVPDIRDDENAVDKVLAVAESVRAAICTPHLLDGRTLHTSPSIGMTLFDSHKNCNSNDIIKQADMAMYRAKEEGRNTLQFFEQNMQFNAEQRLEIEQDLRYALTQDLKQLQLFYQPQVDRDNTLLGAEALLRWNHPQKGHISPELFIPIAENTGLIFMLGRWLIEQSCQQLAEWQKQGANLQLAINISPNEFMHSDFVPYLKNCIAKYQIIPSTLELEITEGVLLGNIEEAVRVMKSLREIGIQFAIDDFGTGYSSLQYLKSLPIAKLKIDQSFVRDITTDANNAAIVTTIISMTKHLDLKVIAEGVESKEEMEFLYAQGCNLFQGYYFSKPVPAISISQKLLLKQ